MRTEQFDLKYCFELYRKGFTDIEMAKELSVNPRSIQHWRLKWGYQRSKKRRKNNEN
jgi:hypothetical protein